MARPPSAPRDAAPRPQAPTPARGRGRFASGLLEALPLWLGVVPFGFVYAAVGRRAGLSGWEVQLMSLLVYSGGAQFTVVRLVAQGVPRHLLIVAAALINLRHVLYGLSLVPHLRAMTLYADANSSYDVPKAIAIGRLMEKYKYGFFEEPVPFDHLDETKQVADALTIQVAGGEQEFSLWGFRRMIHHRAVSIVQPDLHYFGGFVRCLRVARMAAEAGLPCTLHLGGGLGYVDALHFMSCIPNPLAHQECKGQSNVPVHCETSSLKPKDGPVRAGLRLRAQSRLRPQSGAGEGRLKRVSGALVWFGT